MPKKKYKESETYEKLVYKQFISEYARTYDVSPDDATRMIESVFELLKHVLILHGYVSIRGIGNFVTRKRKHATHNNYQTGEKEEIILRKVIKFLPALSLRNSLNDNVQKEVQRYIKKQHLIKRELIKQGLIEKRNK